MIPKTRALIRLALRTGLTACLVTSVHADVFLVDFGITGTPAQGSSTASPDANGNHWNNVTSNAVAQPIAGGTGLTLTNLVTTTNRQSSINLVLSSGWKSSGIGYGGLNQATPALGEIGIQTATQDYFYLEGAAATGTVKLTGLNPGRLYDFRFFGTRANNAVRKTNYQVAAANGAFSGTLQTSGTGIGTDLHDGNNRNVVTLSGIQCDDTGQVNIQVTAVEGTFAYLGIMEIVEGAAVPPIPPPPTAITNLVERWVAQDALDPISPGSVLFVGSSSIRRWESLTRDFADYRIVQRGFGGSQFSDLNGILNKIVIPYQPSAIVVFEGANDIRLGGKTGETVLADFQMFVTMVRAKLPGVPICYLGLTPCPSFFFNADHDARRRTANRLIKGFCESDPARNLHFFDTSGHLERLHDAGTPEATAAWNSCFVDDTHLNRAGYALWLSVVRPALASVIGPNKIHAPNPDSLMAGEKLLFDFGPSEPAVGSPTLNTDINGNKWNNWHPTNNAGLVNSGEHLANLIRSTGTGTGIRMTITGGFLCTGKTPAGGLFSPNPALLGDLAVETATEDYFYSTADDRYNGPSDDLPGGFMLEGLNPALAYEFRFLGSRDAAETRVTEFKVYGANQASANLQTSGTGIGSGGGNSNDDELALITGIRPDSFGQVFIDITLLQGSNTHLNAMEVIASAAPSAFNTSRAGDFFPRELENPCLEACNAGPGSMAGRIETIQLSSSEVYGLRPVKQSSGRAFFRSRNR